jgi:Flp pilus assembly protein CpaB
MALQPIGRGSTFVQGSIGRRDWSPTSPLPPDAITDESQTIGKVAKTDIVQGQLILLSMLADPGDASDAALLIPAGRVAVAYPIEEQSSVAYAIRQGDSVDILITTPFIDVDEEFQSPLPDKVKLLIPVQTCDSTTGSCSTDVTIKPEFDQGRIDLFGQGESAISAMISGSTPQIPRRVAQLTVGAAKVIRVGSWLPDPTPAAVAPDATAKSQPQAAEPPAAPKGQGPTIVTLAVTPQDALVLLWLRKNGISSEMALRAANEENADHKTEAVTLQYMLTRFDISVPPKIDIVMDKEPTTIDQILQNLKQLPLNDLQNEIERRKRPPSQQNQGKAAN